MSEFSPYANYFYGDKKSDIKKGRDKSGYYKPYDTGDEKFDFAWLLHQKRNDHHWQWWILPKDEGGFKVMPMKKNAIKEMICDWIGAGKAIKGSGGINETIRWYRKNKDHMILHAETKRMINLFFAKWSGLYQEVIDE